MLAKQMLSQLSYTPLQLYDSKRFRESDNLLFQKVLSPNWATHSCK